MDNRLVPRLPHFIIKKNKNFFGLREHTGTSPDQVPLLMQRITGGPLLMYPGSHSYLTIVPYDRPKPLSIVTFAWGTSGSAAHCDAEIKFIAKLILLFILYPCT